MKKYLNIFVAVLLSVFTVSLASCSKDDDEPDNGKGSKVELTVNGTKYTFNQIMANSHDDTYSCFLYTNSDESLGIMILDWDLTKEGHTFNSSNNDEPAITVTWGGSPFALTGGNIKVDKLDKNSITLSFNDASFKSAYTSSNCVINGTAKLPLD